MSEDLILAERRWADLALLQEHYINFEDLVVDVMTDVLGFTCTDVQEDIASFLHPRIS